MSFTNRQCLPESHLTNFFDLPGEIRSHIYRLTLFQDWPVLVGVMVETAHSPQRSARGYISPCQPELLRASRQIRAEASSIFYSENCFEFRQGRYGYPVSFEACRSAREHFSKLREVAARASEELARSGLVESLVLKADHMDSGPGNVDG